MRLLLAALAIGVPAIANLLLFVNLREHRLDIDATQAFSEGRSPFGWLNVLAARNYSSAGRRLLWWYKIGLFVQFAGFLVAASIVGQR